MQFDLTKNNMGELNNEHLEKNFEFPATWNCKRITANCSLRFPMKNQMLKVSTENHVYGKRQTANVNLYQATKTITPTFYFHINYTREL